MLGGVEASPKDGEAEAETSREPRLHQDIPPDGPVLVEVAPDGVIVGEKAL